MPVYVLKQLTITQIIKNKVMKTILTFLMPLIAIVAGITSFHFFANDSYNLSAIFTVVSYLSASAWVYLITQKAKVVFQ